MLRKLYLEEVELSTLTSLKISLSKMVLISVMVIMHYDIYSRVNTIPLIFGSSGTQRSLKVWRYRSLSLRSKLECPSYIPKTITLADVVTLPRRRILISSHHFSS